jgi:hypothetical protein
MPGLSLTRTLLLESHIDKQLKFKLVAAHLNTRLRPTGLGCHLTYFAYSWPMEMVMSDNHNALRRGV